MGPGVVGISAAASDGGIIPERGSFGPPAAPAGNLEELAGIGCLTAVSIPNVAPALNKARPWRGFVLVLRSA